MKIINFISFLLVWSVSSAQPDKYKGIWITPEQELMQIEEIGGEKKANWLSSAELEDDNFFLIIYGDTLSFQRKYTTSGDNYRKVHVERCNLKVIHLTDTSLIVKPVSSFAKKFFFGKQMLTFTRQAYAADKSIKFEKIVFHTSTCYGSCSVYHLQVDSTKQVKLYAEKVYVRGSYYQIDSAAKGYYSGQLGDASFEKLITAIQTCNLRTLRMNTQLCCDGSVITLIVYFNGQRRYFKVMFPPTIMNELVNTLLEICKAEGLVKTNEIFEFEK